MLPMQRIHLVTASLGFGPPSRRGLHSFNLFTHTCHFHSLTQHEFNNLSVVRQRIVLLRISQKLPSTQSTTPVEPTRLREYCSLRYLTSDQISRQVVGRARARARPRCKSATQVRQPDLPGGRRPRPSSPSVSINHYRPSRVTAAPIGNKQKCILA